MVGSTNMALTHERAFELLESNDDDDDDERAQCGLEPEFFFRYSSLISYVAALGKKWFTSCTF